MSVFFRFLNHFTFAGAMCFFSCFGYSSCYLNAQDKPNELRESTPEPRPSKKIVVDGVLEESGSESASKTYSMSVDLPGLDVNSKYEIVLRINNPYDREIVFAKAVPNCICSSVNFETNVFLPKSSTLAKVQLETAKSDYSGRVSIQIGLYSDLECQRPISHFQLSGDLQGSLAFAEKQAGIKVGGKSEGRRLPIRFTNPVNLERLELLKSDSLKKVSAKIVAGGQPGEAMVQLYIDPNELEAEQNLVGNVTVRDRKLKIEDVCSVLFMKQSPVVLSPEELRFRPLVDDLGKETGGVSAKFILRIEENPVGNQDKKIVGDVSIRCFLRDQKMNVSFQKLGSSGRVFRGEVLLPENFSDAKPNDEIRWEVVSDSGERFTISTFFSMEN